MSSFQHNNDISDEETKQREEQKRVGATISVYCVVTHHEFAQFFTDFVESPSVRHQIAIKEFTVCS